jgi:hypothetical protein
MPTENEQKWIAAWRSAGPELARLRSKELCELDDQTGTVQATWLGIPQQTPAKSGSGLLEFQKWMIKWRSGVK